MVSVGGGGGGGGFAGIVASSANISTFVNNMVSLCNQYNLDGIDIDWEYRQRRDPGPIQFPDA